MRKLTLWLVLAVMAVPAYAAKRVTVAQLEQTLTAIQRKSDTQIAKQLYGLELTERLNAAKVAEW